METTLPIGVHTNKRGLQKAETPIPVTAWLKTTVYCVSAITPIGKGCADRKRINGRRNMSSGYGIFVNILKPTFKYEVF
jgi:hypothetical protein